MLRQIRLLVGISIFWAVLSMLFDGVNTLVLPLQLSERTNQQTQATLLGLFTFVGLLAGALIQPIAGAFSDRMRPVFARKGMIGIGVLLSFISLSFFAFSHSLVAILISYLAIQVSASIAQAAQQGLIPDQVDEQHRGLASGLKGFMDIGGAMLGFILLGQFLGSGRSQLAIGVIAAALILVYLLAVMLTPEDKSGTYDTTKNAFHLNQVFRLGLFQQTAFIHLLLSRFLFLLGIYATGRFLLFFVAQRLDLETDRAAEQAGTLLAGLALISILFSPLAGWAADRVGRFPLMLAGSVFGTVSALTLIWANTPVQILLFGGLMSLGSAAFATGSWALLADLVPDGESARYFGLANFSIAGSAACAGLLGPVIDSVERISPGNGYNVLFVLAALAFLTSALPLRDKSLKEVSDVRKRNTGKDRADASGLAVLSIPANPAATQEDPHSS